MPAVLHERFGPALDAVREAARAGEIAAGWLRAERSDFVRFNRGRVRQCGSIEHAALELRLIAGGRQARREIVLAGDRGIDAARVAQGFGWLRAALARSQPDPFLTFCETASAGSRHDRAVLPQADEIVDTVCACAAGSDLVGVHASGPLACGFASSLGHRHWHEVDGWCFDFSIHVDAPQAGAAADAGGDRPPAARQRAAKATLAGGDWSAQRLRDAIAGARRDAAVLARPAVRLPPGRHRALLSPQALAEVLGLLAWDGFSARAHRSGHSPLARLRRGDTALDPRVRLAEDPAGAGVPLFQADGFVRPGRVELLRDGRFAGWLASPRTGREFGLPDNGAAESEAPQALAMAGGELDEARALARLGTGVSVGNLWYLNFSDREACRITGMTRFATLWVQDGEPVAPLEPMRFDDSLYRMLGEALEALTAQVRRMPDTDDYEGRRFGSIRAPGALLRGLDFTL